MKLFQFFKIKKTKFNKVLDNLTTVEEKLEHAKEELFHKRDDVKKAAISIHENYKKAANNYNLNQNQIKECKKQIEAAMSINNEDLAKRLFINLEALQSAEKYYTDSFATMTKRKENIDKVCTTVDAKIQSTQAKIKSLEFVRQAQEATSIINSVDTGNIKDFLKEIEDFIQEEQWKIESKAEVEELMSSPEQQLAELTGNTEDSRWEAYKKTLGQGESKAE
jgi:phage shock protein A